MTNGAAFVDELPKAELHIHIEGSLEPELMLALARRNGVRLAYDSVDALRRAYSFTRLQDFLDLYYQGMSVLRTEQDFYDLAWAYLTRVHGQNVRYVEMFFDPQGHTARGVAFSVVIDGLSRALADAGAHAGRAGPADHVLPAPSRRGRRRADARSGAAATRTGSSEIGLDSSEVGHPPSKFKNVFRRARQEGLLLVAHAGEEGPPQYVWEALDVLGVDRIDHGNRALEDAALVARLARDRMALTVCPLSNLRLCVVDDLRRHPLRRMLDSGLVVTLNSDDPAYFGGYMNENFRAVQSALDLSEDELRTIARNGFAASFMPEAEKAAALAAFDSALSSPPS